MRPASPSGWSDSRSTLTGGSSNHGAAPPSSGPTAALASTSSHQRSSSTAGCGRGPSSTDRSARRTPASSGRPARAPGARREAAREQHLVAFAQRDLEVLGDPLDHGRGRAVLSGLDVAEVPRRDLGQQGQALQLRQVPALAPLAPARRPSPSRVGADLRVHAARERDPHPGRHRVEPGVHPHHQQHPRHGPAGGRGTPQPPASRRRRPSRLPTAARTGRRRCCRRSPPASPRPTRTRPAT